MIEFDIGEVSGRFPSFRVGMVVATGLHIETERPALLEQQIAQAEQATRQAIGEDTPLGDVPELGIWRETYRQFGVKKTSFRSSVERLVKKVRQGDALPRVNTLVDSYNLISLRYRMPVGADDLDKLAPPVAYRFARTDDTFIPLGDPDRADDPPLPGEVVYADTHHIMCRRWNWYQDARSAINIETTRALLNVEAIEPVTGAQVAAASAALADLLAEVCGAATSWRVFDTQHPSGQLETPIHVLGTGA
jgi:DNA/RNA-binding domain of Phe-tRNA-synthetase-like protein